MAVRDGCAVEAVVAETADGGARGQRPRPARGGRSARIAAQPRGRADARGRDRSPIPARLDVRGEVACGRDVVIDVNVVLEGKVRARRPRAHRRRTACCATASIGADSEVHVALPSSRASVAGGDCVIGPFARLRPGTRLADGVHSRQLRRGQEQRARRRQQGEPPHLPRRHDAGRAGQRRRRHHHLQLRRREQAPHDHRRRRLHRLGHHAGGAGRRSARTPPSAPARRSPSRAPAGKLTLERSRQVTIEGWKRPEKKPK